MSQSAELKQGVKPTRFKPATFRFHVGSVAVSLVIAAISLFVPRPPRKGAFPENSRPETPVDDLLGVDLAGAGLFLPGDVGLVRIVGVVVVLCNVAKCFGSSRFNLKGLRFVVVVVNRFTERSQLRVRLQQPPNRRARCSIFCSVSAHSENVGRKKVNLAVILKGSSLVIGVLLWQ